LEQKELINNCAVADTAQLYAELWVSLASLLRSYTAIHGLNGKRQATVELGEDRILVRCGESWLDLRRGGATVNWQREDGRSGMLELTEAGQLRLWNPRPQNRDLGRPSGENESEEEEMDMAAERWARELMQ
jgi:hypothetical protein